MLKRYHGNFSRLVKDGKTFTNYLVQGREVVHVANNVLHIIGTDHLMTVTDRAKVFHHRGYTIIRDCGRYHIFS